MRNSHVLSVGVMTGAASVSGVVHFTFLAVASTSLIRRYTTAEAAAVVGMRSICTGRSGTPRSVRLANAAIDVRAGVISGLAFPSTSRTLMPTLVKGSSLRARDVSSCRLPFRLRGRVPWRGSHGDEPRHRDLDAIC